VVLLSLLVGGQGLCSPTEPEQALYDQLYQSHHHRRHHLDRCLEQNGFEVVHQRKLALEVLCEYLAANSAMLGEWSAGLEMVLAVEQASCLVAPVSNLSSQDDFFDYMWLNCAQAVT
jgi:hypothetical protein